jgi:hypothetical protein
LSEKVVVFQCSQGTGQTSRSPRGHGRPRRQVRKAAPVGIVSIVTGNGFAFHALDDTSGRRRSQPRSYFHVRSSRMGCPTRLWSPVALR